MDKAHQPTDQPFVLIFKEQPRRSFWFRRGEPAARALGSSAGVLTAVAGLFAVFVLLLVGSFIVLQLA